MTTAGILLAAGGGSRFVGQTHKLLAPFRGQPVVVWSLDALLHAGLDEVAVVVGAVDLTQFIGGQFVTLVNNQWADGQATSLALAQDWAAARGHDAMVIGLGDQPLVPAEAWSAVANERSTPIATASFGGQRRPPVRLSITVWPLLPRTGDEGARVIMAEHPELVTVVACQGEAIDIDTVEDLERYSQ